MIVNINKHKQIQKQINTKKKKHKKKHQEMTLSKDQQENK